MITSKDKEYLKRCIELAEMDLNEGHSPFGSILVSREGKILREDYNRNGGGIIPNILSLTWPDGQLLT